jgi:RNA polymerase sigma-70 factor (ECF subfamily)
MTYRHSATARVTSGGSEANTSGEESVRPDDAALRGHMVAYQAGSLDGFHGVYAVLAPPLQRYLRFLTHRADIAEDLLQETFLQMHRSRASYDPRYPVTPWAFGLARNVYFMHRRASGRFAAVHASDAAVPDVPVPAEMEQWAARDLLLRALGTLDPAYAEPLLLHHVWGFSFDEIGGMLGLSSAAARARSSRAMTTLRTALSGERGSR